jgi:Fe-Mn family superoxide dismutase
LGQRLVVEQIRDHQNNISSGTLPLLVLDMWEHAYYLQYRQVKSDWVTAFWRLVDWEEVARRFHKVRTLDLPL